MLLFTMYQLPCHTYAMLCASRQVKYNGITERFWFQFLGTKGDWPWLRSAYKLSTGFTSKRKCHRCAIPVPLL